MQANETLKPHFTERINNPNLPTPEAGPKKEKNWADKLKTSVGDTISDIATANKMAKDKFEGDSAVMQVAKGGMTTLIGVGLEKALDGTWKEVMGGKPLLERPKLVLSQETRDQLRALEQSNTPLYHFITQASKDLATGVIYNGLAFFSRPMLKSASGEHMLASLAVDAAEAWGTKGLSSHLQAELATAKKNGFLKEAGVQQARIDELGSSRTHDARHVYEEATKKHRAALHSAGTVVIPVDESLEWQANFNKILNYSNPATNLGLSMMIDGASTLFKNFKEVKKVRKEKGGLAGKKVEMPKKGGWQDRGDRGGFQPRGGDRREQHSWQDKKDKVYYGQSNKAVSREEEDLAKAM
ncbi:hypothetical protein KBC80_03350 [Candidatus Woesebacteria bacterium]|nr:hypothetical protein [Candidatus Woesebacteria bacterium]